MQKRQIILISTILIFGYLVGYFFTYQSTHCLSIYSKRDIFYGTFARKLKAEMENRGYNFSCPLIFPRLNLEFAYTNPHYQYHNPPKHSPKDINVMLIGDCSRGFDIEFLKKYHYLLPINDIRFGFLASENFKAVHFPIVPHQTLCRKDYSTVPVDIQKISLQLDDFIQRAWHDQKYN